MSGGTAHLALVDTALGGAYNDRVRTSSAGRAPGGRGVEDGVAVALDTKLERVRGLMAKRGLDALVLSRFDNLAWLSGGADTHVGLNTEGSICQAVITAAQVAVVTNNIEAPRLVDEELGELGWPVTGVNWYDGRPAEAVAELAGGDARIGGDTAVAGRELVDLAPLRYALVPEEVAAYRALGADLGAAVGEVAHAVAPGETEFQAAGRLSAALFSRGITPVVLLVAADDRVAKYRHPVPTSKVIDDYVMLVSCGRRKGLIVALSRLVKFSALSDDLAARHQAVCEVDATFITSTTVGARASAIFAAGVAAYQRVGFGDEWKLHHQGGSTGYAGRDYKATFSTEQVVEPWQAFAWNPSIAGTKSEDTMLATPDGPEIISASPDWPLLGVEVAGVRVARPDILVR